MAEIIVLITSLYNIFNNYELQYTSRYNQVSISKNVRSNNRIAIKGIYYLTIYNIHCCSQTAF